MRFSSSLVAFLGASLAAAAPASFEDVEKRACTNTATARNCWGANSITDNTETVWPSTGVTRTYNFNVAYATLSPDGVAKKMMVVNGQYPGPTIEGNWGDTISVRVCNSLPTNGTGIHFHGVRQLNTNYADGTISQTECPIAPGDCHTYVWQATQYGSSWYHSHYSLQYGEGLLGPIVIHGPNTANYDIDLGPVLIQDYYHESVFALAAQPLTYILGVPPVAVNGLINGKNNYSGSGKRAELHFTPGKKHLLRLVNTGSEMIFRFGIDNHKMTVVAMDWVPIVPYVTDTILLAVGQRFDVIVEANQTAADYYARAVPMTTCFAINLMAGDIRAIIRYNASSTANPSITTSIPWLYLDTCRDENLDNLVPYVAHDVGASNVQETLDIMYLPATNESLALRWQLGGEAPYRPPKNNPVVKQMFDTPTAAVPAAWAPIDLSNLTGTQWVYLVIESFLPLPHPIHLHGHDTYVLLRGGGLFLDSILEIQDVNPPRRDTVTVPQNGFLVLAFKTDNPGAWLLHCHIQWHLNGGFGLSILERPRSEVRSVNTGAQTEINRVCSRWAASGLENLY
ncbi:Cupredoxin [Bombardia bombarda]|uniref:Cupredoxin n=1 Tax=Bombardia bombarda TaxID=252184 RepID=A0AA39X7M8_9PEZI|nr:Cupredoxin [Bombardia bombarda]